ncbi:DNA polymerase III subunit delta [Candidatus Uhrbacteria bacterium]|nr:DNA polymerase III subunit delta [Candidatus Uhrbacteria bacterium]
MIILIYGQDTFRSRERLQELERKFREKFDAAGYNVNRFDGAGDLKEIRTAATSSPFLGTKRLVIITNLLLEQGAKEEVKEMTGRLPESTIFLLWEEGDEKTLAKIPLFAAWRRNKEVKIYPFPPLTGLKLEDWARLRAKELGIKFLAGALPELVSRIGSDLWCLATELEKLAAAPEPISVALIRETVRGIVPENIFGFIEALSERKTASAIAELSRERFHGITVPHLLAMISRQIRLLRSAQSYLSHHPKATAPELAQTFGWHPFVAKKILAQARKFEPRELGQIHDALFEADRTVKHGLSEADTVLDVLVARILEKQTVG